MNETLYELNSITSPISSVLVLDKILVLAGKDGNIKTYDKDTGSLL